MLQDLDLGLLRFVCRVDYLPTEQPSTQTKYATYC